MNQFFIPQENMEQIKVCPQCFSGIHVIKIVTVDNKKQKTYHCDHCSWEGTEPYLDWIWI